MLDWTISITKQYSLPFNGVQVKLLVLNSNATNNLTVCKQLISGSFKDVTNRLFVYKYI